MREANYAPYRQSDRKAIYRQYADILVEKGDAYYAFDTTEELDFLRSEAEKGGNTFIYNAGTREKLNNSLSHDPSVWKSKTRVAVSHM